MKFLIILIGLIPLLAFGQSNDTIQIKPSSLDLKHLQTGEYSYLIFLKKTPEQPAIKMTLATINVKKDIYNGKDVFVINQKWDSQDTIVHTAHTILDANTCSNILHEYYWRRLGYSSKYDFSKKLISYQGNIPDSIKNKNYEEFNQSFNTFNLNWHSDLIMFTLLPYKLNSTFAINFYDPGFGPTEMEYYTVTGTDKLKDEHGDTIDCWILTLNLTSQPGYQKFWISKKTQEVLKEEDFYNGGYRYKIKTSSVNQDSK